MVHAPASGDTKLVELVSQADSSTVVSADRALRRHLEKLGAAVIGPLWLLERLKI